MKQDGLNRHGSEETRGDRGLQQASRPAPGKVTLTSKLPGGCEPAVQRKAAASTPQAAAPQTRSLWDLTINPWMDAAHRGITALAESPQDMGQSAGPIQAKGLQENPEVPVRLPAHGGGAAMPEEVRAKMEAAFGAEFSSVRIHEGSHAEAVGAAAYTQGTDIHFAPGQYQPTSQRGQELLGHELTHVVQQSQGRARATTQASGVDINDDTLLEREADEMGARAARGDALTHTIQRGKSAVHESAPTIQRQPEAPARPTTGPAPDDPLAAPLTESEWAVSISGSVGARWETSR